MITNVKTQEVRGVQSEFAPFLEKILWGTDGARYTLQDYEPTLRHLPDPLFLTLRKDARLIGLRMVLEKQASSCLGPLHCFYHSLFSIDPQEKGKGFGKELARRMLERIEPRLGPRGLIYSHVETDNRRSARVHEALGYRVIGGFHAMTFSRLFPRPSIRVSKLRPAQKSEVLDCLNRQYKDHALTDFSLSLSGDDYFVLIEGGRILAGAQILPQRWVIRHLAGTGGVIALRALPHLPVLRDLFNPRDFRFLKVGNVFFREGAAKALYELLEGLLCLDGLKTAMFFMDKQSPVYRDLLKAGSLGFLNALTETPVTILGRFRGVDENDIQEFIRRPKVISPVDI